MEVTGNNQPIFSASEIDRHEGEIIEQLKASSRYSVPDPDEWLDVDTRRNLLLTSADWVIDWARRSSLWTAFCFPACCAFEFIAVEGPRFDMTRFGMDIVRASPRQADLMITAGTLTWKMAPNVKRIYDQMAEPKWVIAMGNCAISGGIFRSSYAVVPGYNKIIPVDVYMPGCPPRPEAIIYAVQMLQKKLGKLKAVPDLSDLNLSPSQLPIFNKDRHPEEAGIIEEHRA